MNTVTSFSSGDQFEAWAPGAAPGFDGKRFKELLLYLERNGGFDDIYVAAYEPIMVKAGGALSRVVPRELEETELYAILQVVYAESAQTELVRGQELDFSYELRHDRQERYRYRGSAALQRSRRMDRAPSFVLRSIKPTPPHISEVGLTPEFVSGLFPKQGLVIVAGETGSGKSTLLSSAIRYFVEELAEDKVMLTAEAPIEYVYDAVDKRNNIIWQREVEADGFAPAVRNMLRRSPDFILVGEMRDAATVEAGIRASMTGHGVLATVHANSVVEILRRMANEFPGEERDARLREIVANIRVGIVQYLARRTTGGRVPIRGYFFFDQQTRADLLALGTEEMLAELERRTRERGNTMLDDARAKHAEGLISDEEYQFIQAGV